MGRIPRKGPLPPDEPPNEPMLDDPSLHARSADPFTSHAAMAAYDPERMRSAMAYVIQIHKVRPLADFESKIEFHRVWPSTCDESLYRQARNQARNQGYIRDSGQRLVNPSTKRLQVVWEACTVPTPEVELCPTCHRVWRRKKNPPAAMVGDGAQS